MPAQVAIPEEKPNRTLIIVVAVIAALLIGGFFLLLMRGTIGGSQTAALQNSVRPGSPDWDKYSKLIVLDEPSDCPEPGAPFCATESKRALGDIVMTLRATVRNFTGRTITGLEVRGYVVDHQNVPVRQKTIVVIPVPGRGEVLPNKTTTISVLIDGFTDNDDRANTKMEVTGFTLK